MQISMVTSNDVHMRKELFLRMVYKEVPSLEHSWGEKTLYSYINYVGGEGRSRFGPVGTMIMLAAQVSEATTLIITNEIFLENDSDVNKHKIAHCHNNIMAVQCSVEVPSLAT